MSSHSVPDANCSIDFASLGPLAFLQGTGYRQQIDMRFGWIIAHEISCGLLVLIELVILLEIYRAWLLLDLTTLYVLIILLS